MDRYEWKKYDKTLLNLLIQEMNESFSAAELMTVRNGWFILDVVGVSATKSDHTKDMKLFVTWSIVLHFKPTTTIH